MLKKDSMLKKIMGILCLTIIMPMAFANNGSVAAPYSEKYFEEAKQIWTLFVPPSGQAKTVQGELLRAVERLRDEAARNGNLNWDDDHAIWLDYLQVHLSDAKVYPQPVIDRTIVVLDRLRNFENPYVDDDLYDELSDSVVVYYQFYGSQNHLYNPKLHR